MESPRPKTLEFGLFLLVAAMPLIFLPFTLSPFADVKLVLLMGGALAVWLGAPPCDRRLRQAAAAWVLITFLASVFGVDRGVSLTASQSGEGSGFLIVLASAALLVAGPGIDADLLERVRRWFVWIGVVVAVSGVLFRVEPGWFAHVIGNGAFSGGTLGNQLFSAAFCSGALAAVLGGKRVTARDLATAAVIAVGIASFGERSSLILPPLVCAVLVWRLRPGLKRAVAIFAVVIGPLALWQVGQSHLPATGGQSAVGQLGSGATDSQRFVVWRVAAGAAFERPVLGWGPGTTQSAYLHAATAADVARTTRTWADAHDLFLETLVSSGILGLLALLAVTGLILPRAFRTPPERAWALAAAAAFGAFSLVEPVCIVLTPLLFLFAGVAAGPGVGAKGQATGGASATAVLVPLTRPVRTAGAFVLSVALVTTLLMLVAAGLQLWGDTEGEPWAYRAALDLAPWRVSAAESLALRLVSDANSSDRSIAGPAAEQARTVIAGAVAAHPWDPGVRIVAINVDVFLRDFSGAARWAGAQASRFPADASLVTALQKQVSDQPTG